VCDISSLKVNGPSEPGRLRDVCVCQWVKRLIVQLTLDIQAADVTRLGSRLAVEARSALPNARSLQHVMQECVHPFASSCQFITALRRNISCRNSVYLFPKVSNELEC